MTFPNDMEDETTPEEASTDPQTVEAGTEPPTEPVDDAPPASVDLSPPPDDSSDGTAFMGVPIEVTISVGKARPLVSDLVKLRRDSVISLDTKIDDPVDVFIGDRLIARGELQEIEEMDGQLGVRLTEVVESATGV